MRRTCGELLAAAWVDPAVFVLRPDYRAVLLVADGLAGGPSDAISERWLTEAEQAAVARLAGRPPEDVPEVAAWGDAYRAFGAKPQRTRPSVAALLRRCEGGLPRIDRITDLYNAISVSQLIPVGGEDLAGYRGPARLVRATGDEPFDTTKDGVAAVEHPEPGEVVWRDDAGVTCRRWNWRQCLRTRIGLDTSRALFVLDLLDPVTDERAVDALTAGLRELTPGVSIERRTITPTG